MKITAREALENECWSELCDLKRLNHYAVAEGMDDQIEMEITVEQAKELLR